MITEYPGEVNNFRRSNWKQYNWRRRGIRYENIKKGLKPTTMRIPADVVTYYLRIMDARRLNIKSYRMYAKGVQWI